MVGKGIDYSMVGEVLDFLVFAYTIIRCCHISESDARLFLQLFHVPRTLTVHTEIYTCIVYAVETRFSEPPTIPSFQLLERPYQACMHNKGRRNWAYICT